MADTRVSRNVEPILTNTDASVQVVETMDFGGTVDAFRLVVHPYAQRTAIIEEHLISFNWREDAATAGVSVEFVVKNSGDWARLTLAPGNWVWPQYYDPILLQWINLDPPLYIWEREVTDYHTREARISAFDIVSFLQRQGRQNWMYREDDQHKNGWRADEIARQILYDLEIEAKLFRTGNYLPFLYMQSHTPYEAIVKAYTRDRQLSQIRFRIRAEGKKVLVLPYLHQERIWDITEGSNLVSSSWMENLEGFFTEVILLSTTNNEVNRGTRAISGDIRRYGLIRNVVTIDKDVKAKVLKQVARIMLQNASRTNRTVNINAQGLMPLRATEAVYVKDSGAGLAGRFFVETVEHNIVSGQHSMSIKLTTSDIVPTNYPDRSELVDATSPTPEANLLDGVGNGTNTNLTVTSNQAVAINRLLTTRNSPLRGYGAMMVRMGNQHGVDPRLAAAVAGAETSFGLTGNAAALHNAWGLGPGISYPSWEAGLGAFFRTIKSFSAAYTIPAIQVKYAPSGASNDPTGLNNNWVRVVSGFFEAMGGSALARVNQLTAEQVPR